MSIAIAIVCLLAAFAVTGFLILSNMKDYSLDRTTFRDGVTTSVTAGFLCAVVGLIVGVTVKFAVWPAFYGFAAGSLVGTFVANWLWSAGRFDVPRLHRALLEWNHARQKGKEVDESRAWALPFFIGHHLYSMEEKTMTVSVTVEVDNNTRVGLRLSVQKHPTPGKLFEYSRVDKPDEAATNLLKGAAQIFANSKKTLDALTDGEGPGQLKAYLLKVLQLRSEGKLCIDTYENDELVLKEGDGVTSEWGITFVDVIVEDFELPDSISEAGAEITEADLRERAADVHRRSMKKTINELEGVDPTLIAAALTVNMPDRENPVRVFHIPGLEPGIQRGFEACVSGFSALSGVQAPTTRTRKTSKGASKKTTA
jgi:regulator of protease activity HflC (stomatin/prohibitin superfamily)